MNITIDAIKNNCDINFKVGDKVKYINDNDIEREGIIRQISLVLDSVFDLLNGDIQYLVEYNEGTDIETIYEDNIIEM